MGLMCKMWIEDISLDVQFKAIRFDQGGKASWTTVSSCCLQTVSNANAPCVPQSQIPGVSPYIQYMDSRLSKYAIM